VVDGIDPSSVWGEGSPDGGVTKIVVIASSAAAATSSSSWAAAFAAFFLAAVIISKAIIPFIVARIPLASREQKRPIRLSSSGVKQEVEMEVLNASTISSYIGLSVEVPTAQIARPFRWRYSLTRNAADVTKSSKLRHPVHDFDGGGMAVGFMSDSSIQSMI